MAAAKNKKNTKPKKNTKQTTDGKDQVIRYQIAVIWLIVIGVFSFLSIYSELLGTLGKLISGGIGLFLGSGTYLFPLWFVGVAVYAFRKKGVKVKLNCYLSAIVLILMSSVAEAWVNSASLSMLVDHGRKLKGGGMLGGGIFFILRSLCTSVGAVIILLALIVGLVMIITRFSFREFWSKAKEAEQKVREESAREAAEK